MATKWDFHHLNFTVKWLVILYLSYLSWNLITNLLLTTSQHCKFDKAIKLRIKVKYHKCDKDLFPHVDQALIVIMITFNLVVLMVWRA